MLVESGELRALAIEIDADVDHLLEPPSVDDALGMPPGTRKRSEARFFMASSVARTPSPTLQPRLPLTPRIRKPTPRRTDHHQPLTCPAKRGRLSLDLVFGLIPIPLISTMATGVREAAELQRASTEWSAIYLTLQRTSRAK